MCEVDGVTRLRTEANARLPGRVFGQELVDGVRDPGIADDDGRAELAVVLHADTHRAAPLHEDLGDLGADHHRAAGRLDLGDDLGRDPARAADGVAGAAEVVVEDHGVDAEARVLRGQTVVAVLGGENGLEQLIVGEFVEHLGDGPRGVVEKAAAHRTDRRWRRWDREGPWRRRRSGRRGWLP